GLWPHLELKLDSATLRRKRAFGPMLARTGGASPGSIQPSAVDQGCSVSAATLKLRRRCIRDAPHHGRPRGGLWAVLGSPGRPLGFTIAFAMGPTVAPLQ